MNLSEPVISVVTVNFNGGKVLEKTILSVLQQTYKNVEYLIIDGGSSDNSLEILEKYDLKLDFWISEKDKGIYDAMNKGIELATGDYIIFMNCGDRFYSNSVLHDVFKNFPFNSPNPQILFGNWEVRYPNGNLREVKAGEAKNLWRGSQFCHQSVFIETKFHKINLYNLNQKLVADFEFFYRAFKQEVSFLKLNQLVSSIESGGVSDVQRIEVIRSWMEIVDDSFKSDLYFRFRIMRELLVSRIKQLLG